MEKPSKCPNPLFCKWVREYVNEAKEKGWQSYHTYKKALKSLEKFPLPLKSGRDCSILQGFGPKICTQIDRQLKEYADQFGLSTSDALAEGNAALVKELKSLKSKSNTVSRDGINNHSNVNSSQPGTSISLSQNVQRSAVKLSANVDYMPRYRSGGYALLLTLYQNWQNNGNGSYMTKSDLMRSAQNFCDSSFFLPSNDNSHYTAWSSMSTLIHKRFVIKVSNPAKYSLTEEGIDLCQRMLEAVREQGLDSASSQTLVKSSASFDSCKSSSSKSSLSCSQSSSSQRQKRSDKHDEPSLEDGQAAIQLSSDEDIDMQPLSARLMHATTDCSPSRKLLKLDNSSRSSPNKSPKKSPKSAELPDNPPMSSSSSLVFSFYSDYHTRVQSKDEAGVTIDDDFGAGFLIMSSYSSLLSSGCRYKLDINGLEFADPGFIFAYLHNEDAPNISNWKCEETKQFDCLDNQPDKKPQVESEINNNYQLPNKIVSKSPTKFDLPKLDDSKNNPLSAGQLSDSSAPLQEKTSTSIAPSGLTATCGDNGNVTDKSTVIHVLPSEEYSIILCIDNREHFGMGKVKQMLLPALLKNNVTFDVRPLPIGDFLWIAKAKDGKEAVLDFIIERKRIDDLASSITDGRFTEQKFRLKRTNIRRVIYLIEICSGFKNVSLPIDRLLQSVTNSQIIDNCDIKIVRNAEDTFTFLSMMTRKIQQIYCGKILSVVDRLPTTRDRWDDFAFDYESFVNSSQKTPSLSVKEHFAKCLLQLKFMTAEKALAVLKYYPTPKSLMSAYDSLSSIKEKESMLTDIVYKNCPRKSIGIALSKSVFYAYNNT